MACTLTFSVGAWSNASAQSVVSLYGVVDVALVYSSNQNGDSNTYMRSGNLAASKLGFKGTVNLGGGTQALFLLENGFESDTGAMSSPGNLFNRQAYLGLADTRYGELTAGRHYTPYYSFVDAVGPTTVLTGATGAHPGDIDSLDTTMRVSNSISNLSPDWGGAQFSALYGLGEVAGHQSSGSAFSAALKYQYKAWNLALGYVKLKNGAATSGFDPSASGSFSTSPINRGYLSADSVQYIATAARYPVGTLVLGINASNVKYQPRSSSLFEDAAILIPRACWQPTSLLPRYSPVSDTAIRGKTWPTVSVIQRNISKYHWSKLTHFPSGRRLPARGLPDRKRKNTRCFRKRQSGQCGSARR
jgi:predicted porin